MLSSVRSLGFRAWGSLGPGPFREGTTVDGGNLAPPYKAQMVVITLFRDAKQCNISSIHRLTLVGRGFGGFASIAQEGLGPLKSKVPRQIQVIPSCHCICPPMYKFSSRGLLYIRGGRVFNFLKLET